MPQLAPGLSLTAAIRYFQITSPRTSHESCFRLMVLLISEPTSCRNSRADYLLLQHIRCLRARSRRNSRGNCLILRRHPASKSHCAATRARTFSYKAHFLPPTSDSQHHAASRARTVSCCRNSACKSHHAATRVRAVSSCGHFLLANYTKP